MTNPRKVNFVRAQPGQSPLEALNTAIANTVREQMIPLDRLIVDDAVQVRVNGINDETVKAYAAVLTNGGTLEAVTVFRDSYGDLYLADGFHRYKAHEKEARLEINAYVQDGERDDVLEAAEEANLHNGLALSLADKKNILYRKLRRRHEWSTLSNRELGRLLGVDHKTIGRWIDEYNSTGAYVPVDRTMTVGADGRTRDTTNIGSNPPKPAGGEAVGTPNEVSTPIRARIPADIQHAFGLYLMDIVAFTHSADKNWWSLKVKTSVSPDNEVIETLNSRCQQIKDRMHFHAVAFTYHGEVEVLPSGRKSINLWMEVTIKQPAAPQPSPLLADEEGLGLEWQGAPLQPGEGAIPTRDQVNAATPDYLTVKPINTGQKANEVVPKSDEEAALLRKYKVDGPLTDLFRAAHTLLETQNVEILRLLEPEQRKETRQCLYAVIMFSLSLYQELVSMDQLMMEDMVSHVERIDARLSDICEAMEAIAPGYLDAEAD